MICPSCQRETSTIRSVIRKQVILTGCEGCLVLSNYTNDSIGRYDREWQKKEYRQALTQPVDEASFARAYPERARELYGDDRFRELA